MARHPPIGPCRSGRLAPTWPNSTRIWSRSATPHRLSSVQRPPPSDRPPATAVKRLQSALGVTQNGALSLGQAVFEPNAVRVTILSAPLGGNAQIGQTVMQATSTIRQVQVALDVAQQTDVAVGDKVTITLPNGRTTPGVVSSLGTVATCPASSGSGGSSSGPAAQGTGTCPSGSSGASSTPTDRDGRHPLRSCRHGHAGIRPRYRSPSPRPVCRALWWYQ